MTTHRTLLRAVVLCILSLLFIMTWMATRAVSAATSVLVITEVTADPPEGLEWIRITHIGNEPTDITTWKFLEDGVKHTIKVVGDMSPSMAPGDSWIIADDATKLAAALATTTPIIDSSWSTLREEGEEIGLVDPDGEVTQLFTYTASGPVNNTALTPTSPASSLPTPIVTSTATGSTLVRINEIFPAPDDGEEWIELYLVEGERADLTGYTLADANSTIAQLSLTLTSSSPFGVVTLSRAVLNNGGDAVRLLSPEDTELSASVYPTIATGNSWAFDGVSFVISTVTTPGAANTITAPVTATKSSNNSSIINDRTVAAPTVDELRMQLTELLPDPKGADDEQEFIEIWNPTSSTIALYEWRLRDARGRSFMFTGVTLEPTARVAIARSRSAIALSNTSGSISLVHPSDVVIDATTYTHTIPGASWARDAQGFWRYTTSSTPGQPNVILVPHDPPTAHIEVPKKITTDSTFYLDALGSIADDNLAIGYLWTLSDGTTSTAPMLQHILRTPGVYRVHLLVTDADGFSDEAAATITVTGPPVNMSTSFSLETTPTKKKPVKEKTTRKKTTTKKSSTKKSMAKTATVTGTVTAAPGRFGATMAFIDSHPFLVTLRTKPNTQFSSLMIGDRVALTGTISMQDDIERLVIKSDAHIRKLPAPDLLSPTSTTSTMTSIRDITIKRYGQLLQTQGTITEFTKRSTYLDDRTGEILIDMSGLGTLSSEVGLGAVVRITGIVRSSTGQPVLATRTPQDLEVITPAPPKTAPPAAPSSWTRWLPPALFALLITALYRMYRRKPDVPPAASAVLVSPPLTPDDIAELVSYHREMRAR